MSIQHVKLTDIFIDGGTQARAAMDEAVVAEYAEQLKRGSVFPPVVVFSDGAGYFLADGFHRYAAHQQAGMSTIAAQVESGGLREAILYAVGANAEHGLRRTNDDKRKAVETMLTNPLVAADQEGHPLSDHTIARLCRVSQPFVSKVRKELHTNNRYQYEPKNRAFIHPKSGKVATMRTSRIGNTRRSVSLSDKKTFSALLISVGQDASAVAQQIIDHLGSSAAVAIAHQILRACRDNAGGLR